MQKLFWELLHAQALYGHGCELRNIERNQLLYEEIYDHHSLFILQSLRLFLNPGSFCHLLSLKHARILFQFCTLTLDFRPTAVLFKYIKGPENALYTSWSKYS
jgi:hypothetical protein